MTASRSSTLPGTPGLAVRGREIPVVLPRWGDPRLRLAAVLLTVQVLGQTVLDFKLSIAQILVSVGVCAVVDTTVTLWRERILLWPASALLTGNSVALILRATGTQHGDWWSLNGIEYFVLAALLALLSKYLVRPGGRHLFNPSNVALVWVLLVVGPTGVFPQYLWWGPLGVPVGLAVAVIVLGAGWVLKPVGMIPMALSFLATFGALVGGFAAAGNSFWAIWHPTPVSGAFYWVNVVLSPEVLIFVFFMMSDPRTAPGNRVARIVYGVATALVAGALIFFQPTEFGVKLGILSSLTVTCALVPLIESASGWVQQRRRDMPAHQPTGTRPLSKRLVTAALAPSVVAAAIITVGAVVDTAALADNEQLILIERGLSGQPNPQ